MMLLTVHEIGCAGHPTSTATTVHKDHQEATQALYDRFGPLYIRGGSEFGTAGSFTGRVFQASHVWSIEEYRKVRQ